MANNTPHFSYYPISLVAALLVGFDVAIVSYLFTYLSVGIAGGLFIAFCGFALNAYVYFEAGPETIHDFMVSRLPGWWPRVFDILSLLGGLLIFLFTIYEYQVLIAQYTFLQLWFTPPFIIVMASAYFIATFGLNKSGLLALLKKDADVKKPVRTMTFFSQCWSWVRTLYQFVYQKWQSGLKPFLLEVVVPFFVGFVVTYAYTSVFTLGALAYVANWSLPLLWQGIVWVSSIAFFIGELYFNCEQNLSFMRSYKDLLDSSNITLAAINLLFIIFANAAANAFISLDAPLVALTIWGGLRFMCGGIQSFCTMTAKCFLNTKHWANIVSHKPLTLIWWTCFILNSLAMICFCQMPYVMLNSIFIMFVLFLVAYNNSFGQPYVRDDPFTSHKTPTSDEQSGGPSNSNQFEPKLECNIDDSKLGSNSGKTGIVGASDEGDSTELHNASYNTFNK